MAAPPAAPPPHPPLLPMLVPQAWLQSPVLTVVGE
jgi:hypothetical protein